jgi:hypothetical protein
MQQKANGIRLADDIMPVKIVDNQFQALANFPQLKLSQTQQHKSNKIKQPVILLFAQKSENTSIKALNGLIAIKKLINHTIAAKLFNNNDLKKHMDFCYHTSKQNQCYQINYQHSPDGLSKLHQQLNALS